MATVIPFKGIIPDEKFADKIVTHSADNYSLEQVKQMIEHNPLSFLSVIYPDFIDHHKTLPHSQERFRKIYNRFQELKEKKYFIQDENPVYYIYKQKHPQFEFNGIIAAISISDYLNQSIKKHEQTLSEREEKLKEYLKYCKINAEPVLFFYEKNKNLQNIIQEIQTQLPVININIDGVSHTLWKSKDIKTNQNIQQYFSKMNYVYIGDGHHRSASSALLAKELKDTPHPKAVNYFLGVFFSESELKVFSFHRVLKNVLIPENFIEQLAENFYLKEISDLEYPLSKGVLGMYWNKKRFILELKTKEENFLDVEILYQKILKKIFHIEDIRNNQSIQYYSEYTYSKDAIEKLADAGKYQIAFFTYPVSVEDIKIIALNNQVMPPKSTYVLPKLLNALVIYSLENSV